MIKKILYFGVAFSLFWFFVFGYLIEYQNGVTLVVSLFLGLMVGTQAWEDDEIRQRQLGRRG